MIRPATLADVEVVRAITQAAYEGYVDAIGKRPAPMDADFETDVANGYVWLFDDEHGAITMFADVDDWHVASVAVDPAAQGQGFGRELMALAEAVAAERGHARITLYTHIVMKGPAALYPRLGYVETGRYTVEGFERIYFAKDLG